MNHIDEMKKPHKIAKMQLEITFIKSGRLIKTPPSRTSQKFTYLSQISFLYEKGDVSSTPPVTI